MKRMCLIIWAGVVFGASPQTHASAAMGLLQGFQAAQQNDHQLRAARSQALSVNESEAQARARLRPQVSLSSTRYKVWQQQDSNGLSLPNQTYVSENDSVGLRQSLYQPRLVAGLEQAQAVGEGAQADLQEQVQTLADRYLSVYLNVLLAQEQLALLKRQKESVAVQLDATQKAFAAGSGTRTDIIETQAQLDRLTANELQSRQALELARFELQTLLGQEFSQLAALRVSAFNPASLTPGFLSDWIQRMEAQAPRLASRRARLKASEVAAGAAKYEGYPSVDLVVQASRSSSDDAYNVNSATRQNAVGITLSVPLYTGGALSSRGRQTAADLTTAQEQLEQTRKQLELQIRQQYFAVTEGIEMIGALIQAKASADQALSANVQSFRAGARRSLDVLAAEQRQLQAALDLSKARYQALLAWVRLHTLVGAANEDLMRQVNEWFAVGD